MVYTRGIEAKRERKLQDFVTWLMIHEREFVRHIVKGRYDEDEIEVEEHAASAGAGVVVSNVPVNGNERMSVALGFTGGETYGGRYYVDVFDSEGEVDEYFFTELDEAIAKFGEALSVIITYGFADIDYAGGRE